MMSDEHQVEAGGDAPRPSPDHEWRRHGALYSRTLEVDPLFEKRTVYWYDSDTREQFLTEEWFGVDALKEDNARQRAQIDENARWTPVGDGEETHMTHVFRVPLALVPDILKKTNNGKDRRAVTKWLKAEENRPFLVRHIKVGV